MDIKFYNSEVIELAKQIYLKVSTHVLPKGIEPMSIDNCATMSINASKELIDKLVEQGYYDTEDSQQVLTEDERKIESELKKVITFGMATGGLFTSAITTRTVNAIRYYVPDLNKLEQEPTIADVIKVGRREMLKARNIGKRSIVELDEYLENHGLSWDMDLTKYGF